MAVGLISSPVQWLLRTVFTPSWGQNVQDTLNNVYAYKGGSRELWISPAGFSYGTNWSQSVAGSVSAAAVCSTAAGSAYLICPIPLFYTGSVSQRITAIRARVNKAGSATTTIEALEINNLSSSVDGPNQSSLGSATSTTAGNGTIALTGLTAAHSADKYISLVITGANNGDIVWAVRVTYDNAAIV